MHRPGRYDECVAHRGAAASEFVSKFFADRRVLMIGGAGFDPRACFTAQELARGGANIRLCLLREHRPGPSQALTAAAEANLAELRTILPDLELIDIEVFDDDGALVSGRRATKAVAELDLADVDDIVVDVSALSIGTSFPVVRLLIDHFTAGKTAANLHVTVAHNPSTDSAIQPTSGDRPGWVHGFNGSLGVDQDQAQAKLWLPQLAFDGNQELGRIHEFVDPDDTCPIVPFPSADPRTSDRLTMAFREELLGAWDVDARNLVFADEGDPLDVYRTILRIDDLRRPVFAGSGGSAVIVSPTGSKLMALGALMACLERDLPVAYLEAEAYELGVEAVHPAQQPTLVHLWLEGEAYLDNRSPIRRQE